VLLLLFNLEVIFLHLVVTCYTQVLTTGSVPSSFFNFLFVCVYFYVLMIGISTTALMIQKTSTEVSNSLCILLSSCILCPLRRIPIFHE